MCERTKTNASGKVSFLYLDKLTIYEEGQSVICNTVF